jgi:hypothetical protein
LQRTTRSHESAHSEFRDAIDELQVSLEQMQEKTREASVLAIQQATREAEAEDARSKQLSAQSPQAESGMSTGVSRLEQRIDQLRNRYIPQLFNQFE